MNQQTPIILIYGSNGWIGSQIIELLQQNNLHYITSNTRVSNYQEIYNELSEIKPTHVISCIGRTSGFINDQLVKTIDYLEYPGKLPENIHDNLYAPLILAQATAALNIHLTYLGTGCIFQYINDNPNYQFTENDYPNFFGSSYSIVKGYTDTLIKNYNNVLNVRIRMPISYKSHQKEFITKLISYNKICSIPNSMTVLDELLPLMIDMALKNTTGTINLVNPGVIEHNEVLQLYKTYVDSSHTWENITYDHQMTFLRSHRSNNHLDTTKLSEMYPFVTDIKTSIKNVMIKRFSNNF